MSKIEEMKLKYKSCVPESVIDILSERIACKVVENNKELSQLKKVKICLKYYDMLPDRNFTAIDFSKATNLKLQHANIVLHNFVESGYIEHTGEYSQSTQKGRKPAIYRRVI